MATHVAALAAAEVAARGAGASQIAVFIALGVATLQTVAVELASIATGDVAAIDAGAVDLATGKRAGDVAVATTATFATSATAVIGPVTAEESEPAKSGRDHDARIR